MSVPPFHLAFPVRDVEEAKQFYVGTLGCQMGRSDESVSYTHLTLPTIYSV